MAERVLQFILHRWATVLLAIVAITAPSVWLLTTAEFASSIVESFVDNHDDYLAAMELERQFSGNPDALLWLATKENGALFTVDTLTKIRLAARDIEQNPHVKRVIALPNIPRPPSLQSGLRGTTGRILLNAKLRQGLVPERLPRQTAVLSGQRDNTAADLEQVKERLLDPENAASRIISPDGSAQLMLIELRAPAEIAPLDQIDLLHFLLDTVDAHGLGKQEIHCSGLIALQAYAFEQIDIVLKTLLPIGGILIAAAVMLVFRRVEVILVTLLIAAVSISWGVALGLLAYGKFSVLMAAVPLMVLVISTADVIHLISSYTAEIGHGLSHRAALSKTFREVGGACVLTSITTFVGFASLMFVPSNTIRQFGFSAAAGVASALLLSVILVPLFLDLLHRLGRPVHASASASRATRWIAAACLQVASRYRKTVIICFCALLVYCAVVSSRLTFDPDMAKRFQPRHPASLSTQFFAENFGGINSVEIVLRGSREQLLDPATFEALEQFATHCRQQHGASRVQSIATVIRPFLRQLDYRNTLGYPESNEHAFGVVAYTRRLSPDLIDSLITPDSTQLRVIIGIQQTSFMKQLAASQAIAADAKQFFPSEVEIIEKGSAQVVGRAVREIIRGHLQGFVFCFTTIFFLIILGLRSLKLGLLSILPNLSPLLFLGGLVGSFHRVVDSDILAVGTLGLGLAVDDTIHFLSRFQVEMNAGKRPQQALKSSMNHTGLAIIRTTMILSVGFLPFAFSGYWSINMLGTYLVAVLFAAVFADLILLPAIVRVAYRDKPSQTSQPAQASSAD